VSGTTILIVEDDSELSSNNKKHLEWQGYGVVTADTLSAARDIVRSAPPDLILLDVQMPDGSGYDFCAEIRNFTAAPIIFLTCRDTNEDIIRGLQSGGDNYITKPFDLGVLSTYVYAALRRNDKFGALESAAGIIELPPMTINRQNGQVALNGKNIALSPKELQLLAYFATHAGREFTSDELLEAVWGEMPGITTNTVKVHISRIKKKLRLDDTSAFKIRCTRKRGYVFSKIMDMPEW
jgi:DNA-binding response OmpR family regulator